MMVYTLGRGWIEMLRIDDVQLDDVLGLRLNVWTSIVLFVAAGVYFVVSARRHPGREDDVYVRPPATETTRPRRRGDASPTQALRTATSPPRSQPLLRRADRVVA